ncbi:MAG: AbrB/MazE/SpoVT family DNA-binding domain-containing protein [Candidatus Komeilibacteria bacterium]|nr:AbrB/MazE/SpoVT family DNA-binding domain-containing protein [Candidatus Komeilibacteria bacterium]
MIKPGIKKHSFYGITTLGKKGQVVIPAAARSKMDLTKGEKLLVFSPDQNLLVLSKLDNLEKLAEHLVNKLKTIRRIIKTTAKK